LLAVCDDKDHLNMLPTNIHHLR